MSIFDFLNTRDSGQVSHDVRGLKARFAGRLALCTLFTFLPGYFLAYQVVPFILQLSVIGHPLGFIGSLLLLLWVLTLFDMWRYVWWDLRLIYTSAAKVEEALQKAPPGTTPEI